VAALLLACPPAAQAQKEPPKVPDSVELLRDVEFGTTGKRPLKMHILRPKTLPRDAMPVLVWIHGGGWQGGSKDSGIAKLAPYAERGYFCASVEYRLSQEAVFPAQIEDCKCAIRFLRAKAKGYSIDPERIGVWGSSAGGHLVALLGTSDYVKELEGKGGWADQSSRVAAVCDFCGPTDFFKIVIKSDKAKSPVVKLFGGAPSDKAALAKIASPLTHITKNAPPFLIVHGDMDATVPIEQAELLNDALKKAGGRVTFHVAKGQGHGLGGPEVDRAVRDFFDRELRVSSK
jgi:acetyl esterase/lipase